MAQPARWRQPRPLVTTPRSRPANGPRLCSRNRHRAEAATTRSGGCSASAGTERSGGCTPPELPSPPRRRPGHAGALRRLVQALDRGTAPRDRPPRRRCEALGRGKGGGGDSVVTLTVSDHGSLPAVCHPRGNSSPVTDRDSVSEVHGMSCTGGCVWLRAASDPRGTKIIDVEKSRPFSTAPRSHARFARATSEIAAARGRGDLESRGDELERVRSRPPELLLPLRRRGLAARVARLGDLLGG
jgi:hypothetical protein